MDNKYCAVYCTQADLSPLSTTLRSISLSDSHICYWQPFSSTTKGFTPGTASSWVTPGWENEGTPVRELVKKAINHDITGGLPASVYGNVYVYPLKAVYNDDNTLNCFEVAKSNSLAYRWKLGLKPIKEYTLNNTDGTTTGIFDFYTSQFLWTIQSTGLTTISWSDGASVLPYPNYSTSETTVTPSGVLNKNHYTDGSGGTYSVQQYFSATYCADSIEDLVKNNLYNFTYSNNAYTFTQTWNDLDTMFTDPTGDLHGYRSDSLSLAKGYNLYDYVSLLNSSSVSWNNDLIALSSNVDADLGHYEVIKANATLYSYFSEIWVNFLKYLDADDDVFPNTRVNPKSEDTDNDDDDEEDTRHGTRDTSSDTIGFPTLPTVGLGGFINEYKLNESNMNTIGKDLWSTSFFEWIQEKAVGTKPTDYIIGLMNMPSNLSPTTENVSTIYFGGRTSTTGWKIENISADKLTNRYCEFACGSIKVDEFFGCYLDYAPYTSVSIYVPFCNTYKLDTNEVMDATLTLKYYVDMMTGECVALLRAYRNQNNTENDNIIGQYRGNISANMPITSDAFSNFFGNCIQLTATSAATAGGGPVMGMLANQIGGVAGGQKGIERTGAVSGNIGFISYLTPYLIIERPIVKQPSTFKSVIGYLVKNGGTVGKYTGWNTFSAVKVDTLPCTDREKDEILSLLGSGVFING